MCVQLVHFQTSKTSWPMEKGIMCPLLHLGHGGNMLSIRPTC